MYTLNLYTLKANLFVIIYIFINSYGIQFIADIHLIISQRRLESLCVKNVKKPYNYFSFR